MSEGKTGPLVGIVLGSSSDRPQFEGALELLQRLGIAYELCVRSAHRTPEQAVAYAEAARGRGLKVLIAGAGMAAHLAGALAARTVLPVIGVPLAAGLLAGEDALLSTVQMPTGVPVATVAVNGAKNAALLAAQILALGDEALRQRLEQERSRQREEILGQPVERWP